jgi:membrane protease YdiL (CAAX protease family)
MGVITAIVKGFILSLGIPKDQIIYPPTLKSTLYSIGVIFPYQIGYAAITEEPLFRGFLWGALRKQNWKEGWINIFQTILFTISHLYYFNTNRLALFITVPLGAFVFGKLASRSNSKATSMVTHGMMNALGIIITYFFAGYFR